MMSHDIIHALSEAVEAWQEVWFSVKSEARPLDLEQLFHRPKEMFQHLMLTALVCTAHSQVSRPHSPDSSRIMSLLYNRLNWLCECYLCYCISATRRHSTC